MKGLGPMKQKDGIHAPHSSHSAQTQGIQRADLSSKRWTRKKELQNTSVAKECGMSVWVWSGEGVLWFPRELVTMGLHLDLLLPIGKTPMTRK